KDYLKELRQAFYPGNVKKQEYSNEKVVAKFQQAFPKMQQKRLSYCFAVPKTHGLALLDMSPLEWGLSDQQKLALGQEPIKEITVDLDILLGEKMLKLPLCNLIPCNHYIEMIYWNQAFLSLVFISILF